MVCAIIFDNQIITWVVDRKNTRVEDLIRLQLQSEEKFTDQRSSHFKLSVAVNLKSL